MPFRLLSYFFFFNDTATTEIYTLSLHDALPICASWCYLLLGKRQRLLPLEAEFLHRKHDLTRPETLSDRKSTRLNSSHVRISYAVFCLKQNKPNMTLCNALSQLSDNVVSPPSD